MDASNPADNFDPTDELLAEWNLEPDEESLRTQVFSKRRSSRDGSRTKSAVIKSVFDDDSREVEPRSDALPLIQHFVLQDENLGSFEAKGFESLADASTQRKEAANPPPCEPVSLRMPKAGDELCGFRLLFELGRGAFARVFLAEEMNLGKRLVALKVSLAEGDEPRILARLQHTNIVPVHSVHDDPATGLRLMCMPYLGGANLSQLLEEAWGLANRQATGQSLVEALDQFSRRLPLRVEEELSFGSRVLRRPRPWVREQGGNQSKIRVDTGEDAAPQSRSVSGGSIARFRSLVERLVPPRPPRRTTPEEADQGLPARQFLRGADGLRAAVWIVARLAEGLDHAHTRGLLHRDLKPANVLIAADGTPMLLDFNLGAEAHPLSTPHEEGISRARLGGTLPYMAPEHLDAFDPQGSTPPEAVDERSDLYSLGLILFEMIAGEPPFPEVSADLGPIPRIRAMLKERLRRPPPSLRARCPDVPPSIDALVAQCLDPDPNRRYPHAAALAEDLRRFLDNLPMKHCPEPSLIERAGKWVRRHPGLCGSGSIAMASLVLLGLLGGTVALAYESMQNLAARLQLPVFRSSAAESQFLLMAIGQPATWTRRGLDNARKTLAMAGMDHLLDSGPDPPQAHRRGSRTRDRGQWISRLASTEQQRVRRQVLELVLLSTRAMVRMAANEGSEDRRRRTLEKAVANLDRAELLDAPIPSVLYSERARYHSALGNAELAHRDLARAAENPPTTAPDLTLQGTWLLAQGDLTAAEAALREAIRCDPTLFWAWFAMGHCHFEQGRYSDAAGDFSACVALEPNFSWAHFNRGLALAREGLLHDAKLAFDRTLELDPKLTEAHVNRALVELELDQTKAALADLKTALAMGCRELGVLAALGETLARLGRQEEAESVFQTLLQREPERPIVRIARGISRLDYNPAGAEADFQAALAENPNEPMALYGLARLIRSRNRKQAISYLDRALDIDPGLADARQLRALDRARLGDRSALDDVDLLLRTPTARRLYNAACALAVLAENSSDPSLLPRSLELLGQAFKSGFPAAVARDDPDLAPLRRHSEFNRLVARFEPRRPAKVAR